MPEENNNNGGIFGTTADINAGSAVEAVQAEQIKRLEEEKAQIEAATPPEPVAPPPSAADLMQAQQEVHQAEQKRVTSRRAVWDADAANARAAARPVMPFGPRPQETGKITFSAPPDARSQFDAFAYDEQQHAQRLAARGQTVSPDEWQQWEAAPQFQPPPMGAPGPPPPSGEGVHAENPWGARVTAQGDVVHPVDDNVRNWHEAVRANRAKPDYGFAPDAEGNYAPRAEASGPSVRERMRQGYESEAPFRERLDSFADIAARNGVDTGVLGERVSAFGERARGIGAKGLHNIKEDWNEKSGFGKLNYAFAASALLQGAGHLYEAENSGNYVTPEQRETAQAGLLPGAGALLGTVAGSALGPGGGWVGGLVGGGVGQLAQGVIGANEAREGAARESSERLAASLGQAADTAGRFKDIMEATGASTQQLGQGLAALQASGPGVGASAIAGAGRSALAEGEYYAADTAATSKFLSSDPALAPLAQTYRTQGELSRGQYQSIANLALAEGDMGEFNAAQMQASRAPLTKDDQYKQLAKNQVQNASSWANKANHFLTETGHHLGFQWLGMSDEDPIVQDQLALNKRKAEVDAQTGADDQKYVSEYADINRGKQNLFDAGLQTKIGEAGFSMAQLRGGGSEVMRGLLPGLTASSHAAMAADQLIIDTDTKMMSGLAADDPTRAGFQNLINSARADQVGRPIADAQRDRLVFDTEQQEQSAEYGLTRSASQMGLLTGRLAGRTNAEMQGQEDILLGSQRAYAGQQRQDAASPLVRPAERSAMLAQANALDADAAQQQYAFRTGGYAQTLGLIDNRTAEAGLGITQAKSFGTSDEVYSAQGREADALAAKMRELTSEIARGGMTFEDMTGKVRQNTQAAEQQAQVLAQRRDDHLAASASNADSDFTIGTAGLSRRVRSGGTGAVDFDAVNAGFQGKFRSDQEAIDAYAAGDPRRKAGQARLASDQAASRDYEGNLLAYAPSVKLGMEGIAAEDALGRERHAFHREMLAPYRSGDEGSNPLTRGTSLERAIGGSLAFLGKEEADMTGERSRRQGQVGADGKPLWDNIAEMGYQRQLVGFHEQKDSLLDEREQIKHDRNFALLRALPETIIGGGGTGNSVSSFSFDALSAAYSPNVLQGSWGSPRRPAGVSLPGSMPGNAVEAFQAYSGSQQHAGSAQSSTATLTTAIQQLAHTSAGTQQLAVLQQIAQLLQRIEAGSQRGGGQAGPPRSFGSTAVQALAQGFNPNRPSK